jgi:hypothetical protein
VATDDAAVCGAAILDGALLALVAAPFTATTRYAYRVPVVRPVMVVLVIPVTSNGVPGVPAT